MKPAAIAVLVTVLGACSHSEAPPPESIDLAGIPSQIRILAAPSRTLQTAGVADEFENWLNGQVRPAIFDVTVIDTPQDALIGDLLAGKGDIAANLLLTFERDDQVAFAKPFRTGIRELVVTGPNVKPLVSLEDIGERTIHVRKSSDHYASLLRLNEQLKKIDRPPAKIVVSDARTDEDLLEMVNAGKIPATVADDYVFNHWRKSFDKIAANPDVAVSQDGQLCWVTRKDTPKLLAVMNAFVASHQLKF